METDRTITRIKISPFEMGGRLLSAYVYVLDGGGKIYSAARDVSGPVTAASSDDDRLSWARRCAEYYAARPVVDDQCHYSHHEGDWRPDFPMVHLPFDRIEGEEIPVTGAR